MAKSNIIYSVGRRKTATARVRLYKTASVPGFDGVQLVVNGVDAEVYFPGESNKAAYRQPFFITESLKKYSASVKVVGSGKSGQLGAVVHGLARALAKSEDDFHSLLKKAGLLTRDSRAKERRKVGTGGKARRRKQSPKR